MSSKPLRTTRYLTVSFVCFLTLLATGAEPEVPGPVHDLAPVSSEARVRAAHMVVSPHDDGLLALIRSDASRPAMASASFLGTTVRPAHHPFPPADAAVDRETHRVDVLVDLHFYPDADADALVERIVKTLGDSWYAESARLLPYLPLREETDAEEALPATVRPVVLYRIGVRLAPIDVARQVWRVAVPVAVRALPDSADPDRALPPGAPTPLLVTFTLESDAADAANTPPPFVAVTGVYAPHLEPVVAVGYVDRDGRSGSVTVSVDPLDRIPETDETNNSAAVALEPPSPRENLAVVRNSVRSTPVEVTAGVGCEALLDLIASQVSSLPDCPFVPDWVRVRPHHATPMPMEPLAAAEAPVVIAPDITVTFGWRHACTELDAVAEKAVEFFRDQWYCENAWPIPLPYAAADSETSDGAVVGSAEAPVAPWAVMIGIRIAPVDVLMTYMRVQAVVQRLLFEPRNTDESVAPERRCVAIDVTVAAGDGTTTHRRELTALYPDMSRTVVSFVELGGLLPEEVSGSVYVDPDNVVEETDEADNLAEFEWVQPPPPDGRRDLFPEGDAVRPRTVTCIPSSESPVLLELIRHSGIDALADIPGFRTVNVVPLHRLVHDLDALVSVMPPLPEFDLVVVGLFEEPDFSHIDPVERLLERFTGEWFAADVAPANVPQDAVERLLASPSDLPLLDRLGAAVLIKLTDAKIARRYWRVSVPVICRAWDAPEPVEPDGPRLGVLDMIAEAARGPRDAGDAPDGDALPWPAPELVTVAFSARFGTSAADGLHAETRDHVWLMPNRHALAVGFLDMEGTPVEGRIAVDPENRIPEFNEDNNTATFQAKNDPPPPVPGRFHARANWLVTEEGIRALVVEGTLTNVGDDVLRLRFTSGLQMDFRFGRTYQWSHDKMFTLAITEVELLPGEQKTWRLTAPVHDLRWEGEQVHIDAFLTGSHYRHRFLFPSAPHLPQPHDPEEPGEPEEAGPDEVIDIIVPPNGVVLDRLPAWAAAAHLDRVLDKEPEGNIVERQAEWIYEALSGFAGEDYLVLQAQEQDGEERPLMCRLKVGPQTFKLRLEKGWNLVSLPLHPAGGLQHLLDAIPGGFAWFWGEGAYEPATAAEAGRGMWLFSMEDLVLEFVGEPIPAGDVPLNEGWNLVGTINEAAYGALPGVRAAFGAIKGELVPQDAVRSGEALWLFAEPGATVPLN